MIFRFFRLRETRFLIAAALAIAGIWGFVVIAGEVPEGETFGVEERIVRWMRQPENPGMLRGPEWLRAAGRDVTALGSLAVLILVAVAAGSFFILQHRPAAAVLVLSATAGGALLNHFLKWVFSRGRPDLPPVVYVTGSSFPSGHAMISAAVYLTLGALLAGMVEQGRLKVHCMSTALLLIFLVGASRVYLGVHYLTDVLAGWLAGLVWAMICRLSYRILEGEK